MKRKWNIWKRYRWMFALAVCLLCGCACKNPEMVVQQEEPTKEEPVKEESVKEEPVKEEPVNKEKAPEEQEPEITIRMVGDILLHDPVEKYARQEDGTYRFDAIFENMKEEISDADLAIVNQEVIIGGEDYGVTGYPSFNAPFAIGDSLVDAGFDVVCHGTNHALDKGKKALISCLDFWEMKYPEIAVLGIQKTAEARDSIYVYEQEGIRIAVLNYTYGTNGIPLPADMPYAVNLLDEEVVTADIERAESIADFTIVCPHWGTEYVLEQTDEQEYWAELFVEHGVDLVLGTHPHVIEPVEVMVDEESGHEMLVYYSLGNFVNWTGSSGAGIANRMVGGMADVTIGRNPEGQAVVKDYSVTALVTHLEHKTNGVSTMRLSEYSEALAMENEIRSQDPAFSYEYCVELCDRVWGDLWE